MTLTIIGICVGFTALIPLGLWIDRRRAMPPEITYDGPAMRALALALLVTVLMLAFGSFIEWRGYPGAGPGGGR